MSIIFNGEYLYYYLFPHKAVNYDKIIDTYYNMCYPFPNANYMFNNMNNENIWKEKISKMYYSDEQGDNWYYITPVTHLVETVENKINNEINISLDTMNEKLKNDL